MLFLCCFCAVLCCFCAVFVLFLCCFCAVFVLKIMDLIGAPKRVNIGVTQMGLAVFDENSIPVKNVIFQTMKEWAPDKKERGLSIAVLPKGTIYLKTADCKAICDEMTANKEALAAIAAAGTAGGMEASFSAAVEEGVPPAGGGAEAEAGSPIYRPPTTDEEAI